MMSKIIELVLTPQEAFDPPSFQQITSEKLHIADDRIFRVLKRSIDARGRKVVVRVSGEIIERSAVVDSFDHRRKFPNVSSGKTAVIVGAGPAGLFAAMRLLESGVKPVVIERGKDVQARRRDLAAINKDHLVNPDSNYCFGEGGAGTYSDGKLYTRSTKRGDVRKILEILVAHGATEEILFDAHPHIGTNKLPVLIQEIRRSILDAGGEIKFNTKVVDVLVEKGRIKGVKTAEGEEILGEGVVLATGHSARDVFWFLHRREILVEAKPYSLGVRVEHPQALIDNIQYHCDGDRGPYLPASSYALVHQASEGSVKRGVFSFCMCPGGFIVPSATSPGEVVVNGMSPSRRDSKFANSGIVVEVGEQDFGTFRHAGPLAGMLFQEDIEQRACKAAGGGQFAPAQRLTDFMSGKLSTSLPETSYQPGLAAIEMRSFLPDFITSALRAGFGNFGVKMKGYMTSEAQIVGVESRTSSPVRIPRDKETLEHPQLRAFYPCGEGAGYAGGIVSAAMDGERCAEALIARYFK